MVIVRLNDWNEFLTELRGLTAERVVRLTNSIRYDGRGAAHLTMVAGYLDGTSIVEFIHYLGLQPQDQKTERSRGIRALFEERRAALEREGFVVKPGRYHVPPPATR
jgi:hypothetical protein